MYTVPTPNYNDSCFVADLMRYSPTRFGVDNKLFSNLVMFYYLINFIYVIF
jgi:hypothetical protein